MLEKGNVQDIYELSPMQKYMLFSHAMDSSLAYIEQFDFSISGDIDPDRMRKALTRLLDRHDILRTVFSYRKTDHPRQVVLQKRSPELFVKDLRGFRDPGEAIENYKEEDKELGFDLSRDVLLRGALLQVNESKWRFVMTFHHIILDGWSLAPIFGELFDLYLKAGQLDNDTFKREAIPYKEYIKWLRNQDESLAASYWKQYLKGYEKPVKLPSKRFQDDESYLYAKHTFTLPDKLNEGLNTLAKSYRLTPNTIFQTVWGILLQKYNYTNDAAFGKVVSGRPTDLMGVESMVGIFINTQPLRVHTEKGDSFITLCQKVHQASFASSPYEYFPLYEIQGNSLLKNNLLDHVIAFENYPLSEQLQELGSDNSGPINIENVEVFEHANYDFSIVANPGKKFVINFIYNQNRYSKETIEDLHSSLITLLNSALSNPENSVEQLNLCSSFDENTNLKKFNQTQKPYTSNSTIDKIFRDVVNKFPEKEALKYREQTFTYQELDVWSDQIARQIFNMGIGQNDTVGLYVPRCPEMVAGLLGVLKAGASCVPIDMFNSNEQVKIMLEEAGVKLVCTLSNLSARIPDDLNVLSLDQTLSSNDSELRNPPINLTHKATEQAYLMYTSGSTGQPKGCIISHQNILSLVFGPNFIDFGPHQVILQTGSPAFDSSIHDIWGSLLHGGLLILASREELLDFDQLEPLLVEKGVRTMFLTTALFNKISDESPHLFAPLTDVLIGGETASIRHCRQVLEKNPGLKITNGYGPTENTTCSTVHIIREIDFEAPNIPIGKPLENKTAYILDRGLNLLPVGAVGEICVGGAGVCLGYHQMPKITAQSFLEDPFVPGGRLYRTGDLGRWLPNGSIEYLGRTDSLVKIRGHRVDLNEIERVMKNIVNIRQVTVQVREINHDKQLCAYFTSEGNSDVNGFRTQLSSVLPQYMIPAFYTKMDVLPLSVNGKIDHKSLPTPFSQNRSVSAAKPSGKVEKIVLEIFASVLGIRSEKIGVNENFFDIGGNSLNMISFNNRLKKRFNREITLTALFEHTSVASLSNYLESGEDDEKNKSEEQAISQAKNVLLRTNSLIQKRRV
ncbi:non-ribosomal peptide synthetase [Oceanobacillus manasiensis]|uniref:non-ribosomal peptide synthetase n=1 Tax=Oceanobacillus manasiensis TaxID=586413 RepID=UPI00069341B0|nr:non-ribosomal peptide synthetase [Oceanobacillus manasiensis]